MDRVRRPAAEYLGPGELQEMVARGKVPPGEAPNLDYTNKATDMVLDYLKDQTESPDQQLLKELGWTPAELQAFLRRWGEMKRAAREDPQARTELVEALRSLGLRPPQQEIRSVESQGDGPRTISTGGAHSNPPAAYADQYRAFRKGAPRVDRP